MQGAEDGNRGDRVGEPSWDTFTRDRNPLVDPLVGPSRVEVAECVLGEDALQVRLRIDIDTELLVDEAVSPAEHLEGSIRRPPHATAGARPRAIRLQTIAHAVDIEWSANAKV